MGRNDFAETSNSNSNTPSADELLKQLYANLNLNKNEIESVLNPNGIQDEKSPLDVALSELSQKTSKKKIYHYKKDKVKKEVPSSDERVNESIASSAAVSQDETSVFTMPMNIIQETSEKSIEEKEPSPKITEFPAESTMPSLLEEENNGDDSDSVYVPLNFEKQSVKEPVPNMSDTLQYTDLLKSPKKDETSEFFVNESIVEKTESETEINPSFTQDSEQEEPEQSEERHHLFFRHKNKRDKEQVRQSIANAEEYLSQSEQKKDEEPVVPENFDQTDIDLMIAFGKEEELSKTVGFDKVKEISKKYDKKSEEITSHVASVNEFTSDSQTKDIMKGYKEQYQSSLLRLLACSVLVFAMFVFENIGYIAKLPRLFDPAVYPVVHIMVDLQLLFFCCALVYKELWRGLLSFFKKPIPESLTTLVIAFTILYNFILCFAGPSQNLYLYNFPAGLCILFTLLHQYLNLKREIYSFNITSSKLKKYALIKISDEEATLEKEAFGNVMKDSSSFFKVTSTNFIDGFFARNSKYNDKKSIISIILPITILIYAIMFVIRFVKPDGTSFAGFSIANAALMLSIPFSLFLTYSFPFYQASKKAFEQGSAILGESSLEEYAKAAEITFEDRNVFPCTGVKVKSVKVYGNNRIDHIMYNASSLFNYVGGPLSDVFDIATLDLGHTDDVELQEAAENGLNAIVAGNRVMVGKAEYIQSQGFAPIYDPNDAELDASGDISIMYMICNDQIAAKMYVQYTLDPDFEATLRQMYKSGICVGIKTFDPNINNDMLSRKINLSKFPVRILKCRTKKDISEHCKHIESGIVSKGSAKSLLHSVALCSKVLQCGKVGLAVKIVSFIIHLIILAILSFANVSGFASIFIALYQLFWILPILFISKFYI